MEIIGIIAEYNPFHNGHLYHINKIKEMYPNSLIILILNGYFLERGEVSLISKENKIKIALQNNIDLVIELPFVFGTQSADTFAYASIYLLNQLKVSKIIFGSESNDLINLKKLASQQLDKNYNIKVKEYLDLGINYPTALNKALDKNVDSPNDLLAISYIKAINLINKNIKPISIKRTNDYHDLKSNSKIISASNVRNKLKNNESIINYIPKDIEQYINSINNDLIWTILKYKINTVDNLDQFLTVDEGITPRLKKYINEANNVSDFISNIKTKRYTYNRLQRMIIHILIGLTKESRDKLLNPDLKIIGFNKIGQQYLNSIKKELDLTPNPLIRNYEYKVALFYELITNKSAIEFEKSNKPIIL